MKTSTKLWLTAAALLTVATATGSFALGSWQLGCTAITGAACAATAIVELYRASHD